jgi:hypothetical protein
MVERFNGRIADVLKTNRFNSAEEMGQTLTRYVALYNHQFPQSALKSKTPMQAMKDWYATHPHLFHKRHYDRPGCDTYAGAKGSIRCGELRTIGFVALNRPVAAARRQSHMHSVQIVPSASSASKR